MQKRDVPSHTGSAHAQNIRFGADLPYLTVYLALNRSRFQISGFSSFVYQVLRLYSMGPGLGTRKPDSSGFLFCRRRFGLLNVRLSVLVFDHTHCTQHLILELHG